MRLIQLPEPLKVLVAGFVGVLVTEGLKALGALLGRDLTGASAAIAASLTTAILLFADTLLAFILPKYEQMATLILELLVAILGGFGLHRQLVRFGGSA